MLLLYPQHHSHRVLSLSIPILQTFTSKEIIFHTQARNEMLIGVNRLTDTLAVTLGPKGKHVIIDQVFTEPKITKDGLTISKSIEFANKYHNMGANLIKQVTNRVSNEVGDGTTTATILAREIFKESCKCLLIGMNPMAIKKGMLTALDIVVKDLNAQAIKLSTKADLEKVATISANNDVVLGKMISNIIHTIGIDGTVNVQNGRTLKHEVEITDGIRFNRGYISNHFINNEKTQRCEYKDVLVFITENKMKDIKQATLLLEEALKLQKPLLLIATDYDNEVISMLAINKIKNKLPICAVKAPAFGDNRKLTLQDYAIATGATVISDEAGRTINEYKEHLKEVFGKARNIIVTKEETIIIEPQNKGKKVFEDRLRLIKEQLDQEVNEYEKEKFQTRLNRLNGGIAILKVGGASETEVEELKEKIDDAICATKAALSKGIVAGGGIALLNASKKLQSLNPTDKEQAMGVNIVKQALKQPLITLCNNAGLNGDMICEKLCELNNNKMGMDVNRGQIVNMINEGIIDPVKIVIEEIVSAVKIAGMMFTTEAAMINDPTVPKLKKKIPEDEMID